MRKYLLGVEMGRLVVYSMGTIFVLRPPLFIIPTELQPKENVLSHNAVKQLSVYL